MSKIKYPARARKRNPRIIPRKGDHLAKVVTFRANLVRTVQRRRVLGVKGDVVTYTPKRVVRRCTRLEWQIWAHNTGLVGGHGSRDTRAGVVMDPFVLLAMRRCGLR